MKVFTCRLAMLFAVAISCECTSKAEETKSASAAIEKGNTLFAKGDCDGAIAAFTEAIRRDPKSVEAHLGRGIAYSRQANAKMPDFAKPGAEQSPAMARYEEAMKKAADDFNKAIGIDKKAVEDYVARRAAANKSLRRMGRDNDLMSLGIALQIATIHEFEAKMQKPNIYEPVAETLALFCQSDQKYFEDELGPEWFPAVVRKQGSFHATVRNNWGHIEFGGGFYHFGYSLELDEAASNSETNIWKLYLTREESENLLLCTKSVKKTCCLSAAELLQRVVSGYDDYLAAEPSNEDVHKSKISILLKFDRIPEAHAACKAMLKKLPDNWWANIVCALVMAGEKSDAAAEQFLVTWAKRNPNFFRYLDLAYYYQLRGQPKKAAAAMQQATDFEANIDWGDGGNSEYRGYAAALYAFENGEYQAAIKLCDKLLPVKTNGNYAKQALRDLKAVAEKRAKGEKANFTKSDAMADFRLFGPEFVDKLLQHSSPKPPNAGR